ncbi:lantibiotic dehydratase [Frankia sp. AiPa1]|nr:lantibiotic dehydratase [Frankia sp. AiPa1]
MIDGVADAVAAASPALAARVAAVQAGEVRKIARMRRVAVSLAGYMARLQGRATPFGLFAGIAPLHFGARAVSVGVGLDVRHQAVVRADAAWVEAVIARLEACPSLFDRLLVTANDLAEVHGGRLVMTGSVHTSGPASETTPTASSRQTAPMGRTVSLRNTAPVRYALRAARFPLAVGLLVDQLAARFPQVDGTAVRELIRNLVETGALITSLRPPLTVFDALDHLMAELAALDAAEAPGSGPIVSELAKVQAALAVQSQPESGQASSSALSARMRALTDTGDTPPMAVDLRLGDELALPSTVAAEAAAAAGALVRLSPYPDGAPMMGEYHRRFLDRFGPGAVVPVARLVSSVGGLGYPQYGLGESRGRRIPPGGRDEQLLALAQQAALDDVHEVVLDDPLVSRLGSAAGSQADRRTGSPKPLRIPPHVDLCVEVLAESEGALDTGDYRLAVCGIGQSAIATSGRFLSLLSRAEQHRFVRSYAALPVAVEGALAAQVSFAPLRTRARNVFAVPQVLPAAIGLGEHRRQARDQDRAPADLDLRDLAVTAGLDRMYVVSLSCRRVVEPVLVCAAARHAVPPLAMFLVDVARAMSATVALFDWGAAAGLPFLPRLRYRRVVLAPARWRVPRGALPGADASLSSWMETIAALRERLGLPERISVGVADREFRLRLDDPMHVELFRDHLRRLPAPTPETRSTVTLTEAPSEADLGWCQGRAHEVLIPMASTATPAPAPRILARPGPLPLIDPSDEVLPGGEMLFAKVFGDPDGFTTLLVERLPGLLVGWDTAPYCWFVRYDGPAPHLRIRLRTTDYGQAATRVGAWVAGLRRHGLADALLLDTYQPEPARYGRGPVLAVAERLFAADSAAALAELTATATADDADRQGLTAASLVDLAAAILGSRTAGMDWLLARRHSVEAGPVDRTARRRALHFHVAYIHSDGPSTSMPSTAPIPMATASNARFPRGTNAATKPEVAAAWQARRDAADDYASLLRGGRAGMTPEEVVESLLHLHHNRVHGPDPHAEAHVWRLARAIALAEAAGAPR